MFKASMVALITPMFEDGSVDNHALCDLIEWHIASNTSAIIACGSTGESATLESDEKLAIISLVVKQVRGRIPVIAGTGCNATARTLRFTQAAKNAGVDAALIVTPYYNRPTQAGLYQHYKTIAENVDLPLILYNVPRRTGCDLLPETVAKLSKLKNIVGIKEANGEIERVQQIRNCVANDFGIWSGEDAITLPLLLNGLAQGVISVTANLAPGKMHAMCEAALAGDVTRAEAIDAELAKLHHCIGIEPNPIPAKWALSQMGKIKPGIRLPLLPLDSKYHLEVKEALQKAGVEIA